MSDLHAALIDAIAYAAKVAGDALPAELRESVAAIKTLAYYQRTAERLTRQLYNGAISQDDFENELLDLMDEQLDRAWREGMRLNELDPAKDMTPEFEAELERIKLEEVSHIPDFADAIVDQAQADAERDAAGAGLQGLYARAGLWANRYPDVVNQAVEFTADPGERYEWELGATEQHCMTCATLDGLVATAEEWEASGFHPQGPPNEKLECGGWRCDCKLRLTDKPLSKDRFDVFELAGASPPV